MDNCQLKKQNRKTASFRLEVTAKYWSFNGAGKWKLIESWKSTWLGSNAISSYCCRTVTFRVWRLSLSMRWAKGKKKKTYTATRNENKIIKIFSLVAYNRRLSLTPQNPQLVYLFCSLGTIILMSMMYFFIFLFLWSLFRKALQRACSPSAKPFTIIWNC